MTLSIETNKKFHVTIESRIFWEKIHLSVDSSDSVRSLKYKLWAITKTKPKEMTFGINIHKGSDGYTFYNSVSDSNNMNQIYNEQTEHKDYKINITVYKKEQTVENTDMDRLSVTKQLFHAFINRSNAYNFPIQIGLMLFGTEVKYACPITPLFEKFKVDIDKAKADGDTKLYDALDQGCQKLMEFRDKQQEEKNNVSLRIIVLTDGDDTMSKIKAYEVAGLMQRQQIVCDAIMIGEVENNTLKNIAKASGGYSFQPSTLQHAMKLCELEVMLARSQRPIKKGLMKISNSWDLEKFKHIDNDICNDDEQPSHKNQVSEVDYKHKFTNLEKMNEFVADTMHSSQIKRLVSELNKLMKDKHPNIDIYIMGDNVTKWHMVITGADSTVYANGCWLVSCNFPNNYPMSPPEIRFITPIKHCNINSYGRVCHSVLDHEYTSDMGMRTIFDCVYGLLLQPDVSDPLDSVLALSFFQASGEYETQIINHTNKYAKRTRGQWQKILVGK